MRKIQGSWAKGLLFSLYGCDGFFDNQRIGQRSAALHIDDGGGRPIAQCRVAGASQKPVAAECGLDARCAIRRHSARFDE